MNLIKILLVFFVMYNTLTASSKCGSDNERMMKKLEYKKAVATFVSDLSQEIAKQLDATIATYKRGILFIQIKPIVNLYDQNQHSIATQKISENLIHQMFLKNFNIVNKEASSNACLTGTYINYKNGMLINARIVDKNSGLVYASAQIFLNKKEVKSINKLYNKYSWFSGME